MLSISEIPILAGTPSFLEGNWVYNLVNLAVAIIGFAFTIWQLIKTRKAANAARDSAKVTAEGFHGLAAMIEFSSLEKWAEAIISYVNNHDFESAKLRLLDLRNGVAKVRESPGAVKLLSKGDWQNLLNSITEADDITSDLSEGLETTEISVKKCRRVMLKISENLSSLAARITKQIEPRPEK